MQGILFLLIASACHGSYGMFSRIIGIQFGQIFQIVARSTFMLIFFVVTIIFTRQWKRIRVKDYKWFFLMILPGLIALVSMFIAFNNLPIGTVLFTYYASSTLFSYLLGATLFQEKITKIKIASLSLCFFGLYFIFSGSLKMSNLFYMSLSCLAGLGAALWTCVSKKISDTYATTQILVMDNLLMIILGLPISFLIHEPVSLPSLTLPWFGILGYAIVAIGSSVFTVKGYKYMQAQTASLVLLIEPVVGAGIGWLFYKETLGLLTIIGACFILFGAALPNIYSKNSSATT